MTWTADYTFDDSVGAAFWGSSDLAGTYATNGGPIGTAPAPTQDIDNTAPDATDIGLDSFLGLDGNGEWQLFVFDDAGGDTGSIAGGWTLHISSIPEPTSAAVLVCGLAGLVARRRR